MPRYYFTEEDAKALAEIEGVNCVIKAADFLIDWNPGTDKFAENAAKVIEVLYMKYRNSGDPRLRAMAKAMEQEVAKMNMTLDEYFRWVAANRINYSLWVLAVETNKTTDILTYFNNVMKGRFLSPGEENAIVMSSAVLEDTGLEVGDETELVLCGKVYKLRIIGSIPPPMFPISVMDLGFLIRALKEAYGANASALPIYTRFFLKLRSPAYMDQVVSRVMSLLPGAWISFPAARAEVITRLLESFRASYNFMAIALVTVAVTCAVGLRGLEAMKNKREIGLLKAMGWAAGDLMTYVLVQAFVLGVASGAVAVALLLLIAPYIRALLMPNLTGVTGPARLTLSCLVESLAHRIPSPTMLLLDPLVGAAVSVGGSLVSLAYYLGLTPAETLRET
ncbi:hypothetical protein DRO33_01875 [Candidatus Bathyarchaeota archaeon]|nr:MAG: hypothetical protein DRO33_01875 [Candidatus Bathyarchaeota archaeon]